MKTALLFVCAATLSATAQASSFCTMSPGTWCEQPIGPDAGQFVSTAQTTVGSYVGQPLTSIQGAVNGLGGADLFAIYIASTSAFSASYTPQSGGNVAGDSQAGLYLFSSTGAGIEAADGTTALNGFTGAAGQYLIGITGDGNIPQYSVSGDKFAIFSTFSAGMDSAPVAGAGLLSAYSGAGCGSVCSGGYDITMAGTGYAATPEPASLLLTGSILSLMGVILRRRRN